MQELKGKTTVITGAGSGFGREFALACAAEGMNLVLADLKHEGLEATAALLACAATEPPSLRALFLRPTALSPAAVLFIECCAVFQLTICFPRKKIFSPGFQSAQNPIIHCSLLPT